MLAIVYGIAYRYRNKHYAPTHPWRKYFIPALSVKIFGAIFIGMVYQYYYGGGDTSEFFRHSRVINSSFSESPVKWFNLLLRMPGLYEHGYYEYISQMPWYKDSAAYTVASLAAFIGVFTFNSYLPTSVIFAAACFTGVWALFRTFATQYPRVTKQIAVATLFIPSTFVWGSGIFKDTICMFGLGWLIHSTFRLLIQRDFSLKNILITLFSFILIAKVKLYILLGIIPAILIWILFIYSRRIINRGARFFAKLVSISIIIGIFLFFMQNFGKNLGKYSLDNIAKTSNITRDWIEYASGRDEGSAYDLGNFEPSIQGMLTKLPEAVNVTFFRPYPWEAGKVIVLLSAIEAFLFLFICLKVIFTIGLSRIWQTIVQEPTIQFCLIFSIIFAFAVGISSYNFGALSRYKIPCLPFFALALILIYYKNKPLNKKLLGILGI